VVHAAEDPIEAKQATLNKLLQVQGEGVDVTTTIEKLRLEIKELKLAKMHGKKPHEQLKQLDLLIERKTKQIGKHDEALAELNAKIADVTAKRDELREGIAEHQEQRRVCLEHQSAAKGEGEATESGDTYHCEAVGAAIKHAIQAVTANLAPGSQVGSQLAKGLEQMDAAFAVLAANIIQADIVAKATAAAVPSSPRVQPASPAGPPEEDPTLDEDMQADMDAAGVKREAQEALFQLVVAKRTKRL
jgi:chromosome segregation ATPase